MSSFLSEQLELKRQKLKPVVTKVTNVDGSVAIFDHSVKLSENTSNAGGFFVVDTKPDLTVGEIRPWLLVSSQDVPLDNSLLTTLGITHILSLLPGFTLTNPTTAVQHLCIEIYDEESFILDMKILQPAFDFINQAKQKNGKVLVHCNAGISRAPSFAILYLMCYEDMNFESAWKEVKLARPFSKPNLGFWNQLQKYQP